MINKELEALEEIKKYSKVFANSEEIKTIETALKRIPELEKEIEDTHKSYSMAIEKLIKDENEYIEWVQKGGYDKDEVKALEIIKEKEVNVYIFLHSGDLETYNDMFEDNRKLTQEEFDLLKDIL